MTYGLTRAMADLIVTAVRHDPICRKILPDTSAFKALGRIHHAGTARNLVNAGALGIANGERTLSRFVGQEERGRYNEDYWDKVGSDQACTGVSAVTAKALLKSAGVPGCEFLLDAGSIDRLPTDPAHDFHTATAVTVTGSLVYVFDWHATLDIGDPFIFPSPADFKSDSRSVLYSQFSGF